jgi:Fur family peroxide stress response transcriptional regulator
LGGVLMELGVLLRERGYKVTPQRLAIYEVLQSCNMHPTAETIYNIISSDYPTMSLATVYKTLDLLKEANIIQELNVGGNISRYDAITQPHPHIVCVKCNKVENLDLQIAKYLMNKASKVTDYKIQNSKLYFYGVCPYCQSTE